MLPNRAGNLLQHTVERLCLTTPARLEKKTNTARWEPSLNLFADLHASICVFICWGWRLPGLPPSLFLSLPLSGNSHDHWRTRFPFSPLLHPPPTHINLLRKNIAGNREDRIRRKHIYLLLKWLKGFLISSPVLDLKDLLRATVQDPTSFPLLVSPIPHVGFSVAKYFSRPTLDYTAVDLGIQKGKMKPSQQLGVSFKGNFHYRMFCFNW